ncbi:MAG TPA: metallophosphoesterase [Bryobacteraceae bacterium]|nr:metallophosphoesterase [Bryobacteraceae bacterium]
MWIRQVALAALIAAGLTGQTAEVFVEKPYLQLGNSPKLAKSESMMVIWHAADDAARWGVEVQCAGEKKWRAGSTPAAQVVDAPEIPKHKVYRAMVSGLKPGEEFWYRVSRDGKVVFEAGSRARKSATQPVRFALFGDSSANTPGQRAVANQVAAAKPDFVFVTGDIVYTAGRISEYREKFFPIYNAEVASPETGAPLLRSVPFIAAPGNHDTALTNFQKFPDALAYFLYWDQPLNGPSGIRETRAVHHLMGSEAAQPAFLAAAAPRYPTMANFSFDYGNAHWTVLDSNAYMDWSTPELVDWVKKDLEAAKSATWRFVAFHHPGFNSSQKHFTDQWMRLLSPVFEAGKVDVVFAGHVHNYQRSFPLTFTPKLQQDGAKQDPKGEVAGDWVLDKEFGNGAAKKPAGVIYIVSGGGGAGLYDPLQMRQPETWQGFTDKFISDEHSFSLVDISGKTFTFKQLSAAGKELDSFRIAK